MKTASERRELLKDVWKEASVCVACQLSQTRTKVVFGAGNADAALMFVGEAPGANEDEQGLPFVGAAGKLLDKLLAEIGMERGDVFIANVLMCRPPNNRDPHPHEIEACQGYLFQKLELIEPTMVCTLGNFSTKLLRGDPTGISKLHGQVEIRTIGPRTVRLYPLYHPAAALYTPKTLELLRADFQRIPEILAEGPPPQPQPIAEVPDFDPAEEEFEELAEDRQAVEIVMLGEREPEEHEHEQEREYGPGPGPDEPDSSSEQLGLF
jgi:DNA polymerase